mgnify:CR=1 FL=1
MIIVIIARFVPEVKCRYDVAIKLSEGNDPLMGRDIQTRIKEVLSMNESMGCSASSL